MADLDTCFFCARTGDVTLDEYDVIPEIINPMPDEQRTVVLCGVCSSKLDLILETVLSAVDGQSTAPDGLEQSRQQAASGQQSETAHEQDVGTDEGDQFQFAGEEPTEEKHGDDPDEPEPIFGSGDSSSTTGDGANRESPSESAPTAESGITGESTTEQTAETATPSSAAERAEPTGSDGTDDGLDGIQFESQPGETTDSETADDGVTPDSDQQSEPEATPAETQTATNGDGSSTNDAESDSGSEPDIDAKTYKRVIRLLRNRELPMDRAEFEELATSAYEIDQTECAAALDAAIERDLLVEANGQLDRA